MLFFGMPRADDSLEEFGCVDVAAIDGNLR
jgi:hypothetical protein